MVPLYGWNSSRSFFLSIVRKNGPILRHSLMSSGMDGASQPFICVSYNEYCTHDVYSNANYAQMLYKPPTNCMNTQWKHRKTHKQLKVSQVWFQLSDIKLFGHHRYHVYPQLVGCLSLLFWYWASLRQVGFRWCSYWTTWYWWYWGTPSCSWLPTLGRGLSRCFYLHSLLHFTWQSWT